MKEQADKGHALIDEFVNKHADHHREQLCAVGRHLFVPQTAAPVLDNPLHLQPTPVAQFTTVLNNEKTEIKRLYGELQDARQKIHQLTTELVLVIGILVCMASTQMNCVIM